MAARKNHAVKAGTMSEQWRARIQGGVLIKRLHDHANGKQDMSPTQVKAAEILLKKALPDLGHMTVTAEVDGKLSVSWEK